MDSGQSVKVEPVGNRICGPVECGVRDPEDSSDVSVLRKRMCPFLERGKSEVETVWGFFDYSERREGF